LGGEARARPTGYAPDVGSELTSAIKEPPARSGGPRTRGHLPTAAPRPSFAAPPHVCAGAATAWRGELRPANKIHVNYGCGSRGILGRQWRLSPPALHLAPRPVSPRPASGGCAVCATASASRAGRCPRAGRGSRDSTRHDARGWGFPSLSRPDPPARPRAPRPQETQIIGKAGGPNKADFSSASLSVEHEPNSAILYGGFQGKRGGYCTTFGSDRRRLKGYGCGDKSGAHMPCELGFRKYI